MKQHDDKLKIIRCATVNTSIDFVTGMIPYLSAHYELLLLSSPGPYLTDISKKYGLEYYEVPMERRMSPLKDLVSLFRLIKVFYKERPFLVHSMTPKAGLLCMMAAWITRVPLRIHTFTGLVWPTANGLSRKLLMTTDRLTCAFASHVIPEGQGVLNDLKNNHITTKEMRVLGFGNVQGVDMERFDPARVKVHSAELKQQLGLNTGFTFVFVGRIVGDKGINELVSAFERLLSKYPSTKLMLIGRKEDNDPISSNTQNRIDEIDNILELGPIYNDDLLAHYTAADCLVFPSYREGFPNTVLEAGALGLPSIVTDINGSREIIVDGKNGLIVPSKNAEALYDAMLKMIENPDETQMMASNAREMIASRFDCHFVRQCLYDFYDEIIKEKQ